MRYVSLTFDDGLSTGSKIVADILACYELTATFFVVSGWVTPMKVRRIRDPYNFGRGHGDWPFWKSVSSMGHEIGSHTRSHLNASGRLARYWPGLLEREFRESSVQIAQGVGFKPSSISLPWNAWSRRADPLIRRYYERCVIGQNALIVNNLATTNLFRANAWAPKSTVAPHALESVIDGLKDDQWLILQYHSIGDEGYEPLSEQAFERLCRFLSQQSSLQTATVKAVGDVIVASGASVNGAAV